jgi:formylglycine-generating enzyme required for sulfatase activity
MQPIAPGTFALGSAGGGNDDERPVTRVTISQPFWMGKTEVNQAQWQAIMGNNPSQFLGNDRPVEQVSWNEAMDFCRRLTERERSAGRLPEGYVYTLPTEAQREYACRAGTTGDYAGNLDAIAWYAANSGSQTHPVGRKQPNAWGLHDMHGNVWEWCLDWYGSYAGDSVTDPQGPASGSLRVARGGSWGSDAVYCRSAIRGRREPDYRDDNLGFRLALSPVR